VKWPSGDRGGRNWVQGSSGAISLKPGNSKKKEKEKEKNNQPGTADNPTIRRPQ
jgi:hypothetical protein